MTTNLKMMLPMVGRVLSWGAVACSVCGLALWSVISGNIYLKAAVGLWFGVGSLLFAVVGGVMRRKDKIDKWVALGGGLIGLLTLMLAIGTACNIDDQESREKLKWDYRRHMMEKGYY